MSVQYGSWSFKRSEQQRLNLGSLREQLAPYGPDGESHFREDSIDILTYYLRETEDDFSSKQLFRVDASRILVWDGRLDNREDLVQELASAVRLSDPDVAIVAAAYKRWGLVCLPKLVGDWALSIWDSRQQQLVLAKDFLGTRPLFYCLDKTRVRWSSVLDPLVLLAGRRFTLNREYLAGWFGLFPASHLTPYTGVQSVPPASYILIRKDSVETREFWRFEDRQPVAYRKDTDYEEHFLELFHQAVQRRLRSPFPILAELSGGMDSSSIVCVADRILAAGRAGAPRLDTVTYYSSIEPNWNELPYVEKVEARRGRIGSRIEVRSGEAFHFDFDARHFMATPGSLDSLSTTGLEFSRVFAESGSRVLLSGIGGDEVLGGAPSPLPQLADLLKRGRLREFSRQLVSWALSLRRPLLSLLIETLALFCSEDGRTRAVAPPSWLCRDFLGHHSHAIRGYPRRTRIFGPRPSFQQSMCTLEALRRQLASFPLSSSPPYRKSYPYLDRDLLEFLFSIPPDQLLRPNERRSLMRRALAGIVPQELLHRKRKAFVIRGPLTAMASQHAHLEGITQDMLGGSLDIVDRAALRATIREVHSGAMVSVPAMLRVFAIERWLRNVAHWRAFEDLQANAATYSPLATRARDSLGHEFKGSLS